MKYQQIVPIEQLTPYIDSFLVVEGVIADSKPKIFKSLVDARPGIVFSEGTGSFSGSDNQGKPYITLHGMTTKYFEKTINDKIKLITVNFKPTAIKSIFGIDASQLTNKRIDLSSIYSSNLTELLLNITSTEKRIDILTAFLLEDLVKNNQQKTDKTNYVLDLLNNGNPEISLQKIQKDLIISERTLERMFAENVGISPKLYSRINRFQITLTNMRNHNFSKLTDIAFNNYYADQSHFIREFKEFAGVTPKQYIKQSGYENFLEN